MSEQKQHITPEVTMPPEPSSFKLIMALGIAGLISGIILVSTYLYTNPLIEANKAAAIEQAIYKVLPECDSFTTLQLDQGRLFTKQPESAKEEADADELLVYAGYNGAKELIGFAIPGSEPGFQDIITTLFGYDGARQVIIGFEVLESKETPGLGDKIFKDDDFQTNFTSLAVDPEIVAVKKGEKQGDNEVETITGATISSKAVIRLLNNTMDIWQDAIDNYIVENELKIAPDE